MSIDTFNQDSIEINGFQLKSYLENEELNHPVAPVLETILLELPTIPKSTTEEFVLSKLPFPICLNSIWIDGNQTARNNPTIMVRDEQDELIFTKRIRPRDTLQSLEPWTILPNWKIQVTADNYDLNRIVINCIKGSLIKRIKLG